MQLSIEEEYTTQKNENNETIVPGVWAASHRAPYLLSWQDTTMLIIQLACSQHCIQQKVLIFDHLL